MPISKTDSADEIRTVLIRLEKAERLGAGRCEVLGPGEFPPLELGNGSFLVLRTDLVYDDRLLNGLRDSDNLVLSDWLPGQQHPEALAAHVDAPNLLAAVAALRRLEFQKAGSKGPGELIEKSPIRFATALELAPAYDPKLRRPIPRIFGRSRTQFFVPRTRASRIW
ncbi:MAG: hypothetical protein JRG94_19575 [Deltaproteobacteria bacterium]|nr:hypothetical protein [Deltaproteobacteria bacterium]